MKALSIKQPWLWAILEQGKRIENREWRPPTWIIGQRIALHASKGLDREGAAACAHIAGVDLPGVADVPRGAIVATAVITGCVTESQDKWFFGTYGWVLDLVWELPAPVACRGALGLWNVPADLLPKVNVKAGDLCPHCKQSTLSQRDAGAGRLVCAYCALMDDVLNRPQKLAEWENIYG